MYYDARFRENEKFCENIDRIIRSRSPGITARELAILLGKLPPFVSQTLRKKSPPPTLTVWDLELIALVMNVDRRQLTQLYLRESHRLVLEVRGGKEMEFALEVSDGWHDRILAGA